MKARVNHILIASGTLCGRPHPSKMIVPYPGSFKNCKSCTKVQDKLAKALRHLIESRPFDYEKEK